MQSKTRCLALIAVSLVMSGCAAYRTSSNVEPLTTPSSSQKKVEIYESGVSPAKKFKILEKIEVSVKKLTLFHADPTKEQANRELEIRALSIGCDAVVNVQYQKGVGLTTWGYIDAQGNCARFD
jgi:hypothetical protein